MDEQSSQTPQSISALLEGYRITQALHVAVRLGIADLLAHGQRAVADLAGTTSSHEPSLGRLLRALAACGVLEEHADGQFSLTELGQKLRADHPESEAGRALLMGTSYHWQAWGDLLHSVQTGETGFDHIHGTDVWTFRAQNPEFSVGFDLAMRSMTRLVTTSVLEAYDFSRFPTIVDVGGGNGTLLAAILSRNPGVRGVLFDQPHVVSGAGPNLQRAGVADRCEIVSGSFFEAVPTGGDAYILKSIIHDWDDDRSIEILNICRRASDRDTTLLLVEKDLGPANEYLAAKLSDLNMLVNTGGRERTAEEYASLFEASGFRMTGVTTSASGTSVFEGQAV